IQFRYNSLYITDSVSIGIHKTARIDLIGNRLFPPLFLHLVASLLILCVVYIHKIYIHSSVPFNFSATELRNLTVCEMMILLAGSSALSVFSIKAFADWAPNSNILISTVVNGGLVISDRYTLLKLAKDTSCGTWIPRDSSILMTPSPIRSSLTIMPVGISSSVSSSSTAD